MQIAKNAVVFIDYTLTGPDAKVIDSSVGKQPLPYIHGTGNLIPGLEKALEGKSAGDSLNVTIVPEEAYGARMKGSCRSFRNQLFRGRRDWRWGVSSVRSRRRGMRSLR